MTTLIKATAILFALIILAGCAPRGELALQDANPDAYEATRGYDDGESGKDSDAGTDTDTE